MKKLIILVTFNAIKNLGNVVFGKENVILDVFLYKFHSDRRPQAIKNLNQYVFCKRLNRKRCNHDQQYAIDS